MNSFWIYSQSTGAIWKPDFIGFAVGYSGYGAGKNNPILESERNVGPIPRGFYVIGKPYTSTKVGPIAIPLSPHCHKAHERTDLLIHGDSIKNPGSASKGCIVLPRSTREEIVFSSVKVLLVIE